MKCIRALFSDCFFFVKLQLELMKVMWETSRHRHRRHPSRRGLAQIDRLRAGDRYSWSYSYNKWVPNFTLTLTQIFVIAKFHVTNRNNHLKYPVVVRPSLICCAKCQAMFSSSTTAGSRLARVTLWNSSLLNVQRMHWKVVAAAVLLHFWAYEHNSIHTLSLQSIDARVRFPLLPGGAPKVSLFHRNWLTYVPFPCARWFAAMYLETHFSTRGERTIPRHVELTKPARARYTQPPELCPVT